MKNKSFIVSGIILILFSAILYFKSDELMEKIILYNTSYKENSDIGLIPDYNEDNVEMLSARTILKYKDEMNLAMPKGTLVIDQIGLNLKIYEGLNNANLMKGACEQLPRNEMKMGDAGNYILAGHCSRYNKKFLFTSLRYLKRGDVIKVSDNDNVYVYKVNFVKRVNKNDTSLINENTKEKLITLYTCDDVNHFYPKNRIVVRATLDKVYIRK